MTVIIIKAECPHHPGCYTITDKCERCIDEEIQDKHQEDLQ